MQTGPGIESTRRAFARPARFLRAWALLAALGACSAIPVPPDWERGPGAPTLTDEATFAESAAEVREALSLELRAEHYALDDSSGGFALATRERRVERPPAAKVSSGGCSGHPGALFEAAAFAIDTVPAASASDAAPAATRVRVYRRWVERAPPCPASQPLEPTEAEAALYDTGGAHPTLLERVHARLSASAARSSQRCEQAGGICVSTLNQAARPAPWPCGERHHPVDDVTLILADGSIEHGAGCLEESPGEERCCLPDEK